MPEELLDRPQVGAGGEEVRRERVPERVRRGVAGDRRLEDGPVEDAPHAAVRQPAGSRVQEHDLGVPRARARTPRSPSARRVPPPPPAGRTARRAPSAPFRPCAPAARRDRRPRGGVPRAPTRVGPSRRGARGARGPAPRAPPRGPSSRRRPPASLTESVRGRVLSCRGVPTAFAGFCVHAPLALQEREERAEGRQVPAHRGLRDPFGAQVGEIGPHGERVHVRGAERRGRPVPEDGREKRRKAREVRAVRGARVGRDAAFVGQVAVERRGVRGEGGASYDGLFTMVLWTVISSRGSGLRRRAP